MVRWLCATVVEVVLSGFAFLLLTGRYINEGRVVVVLTRAHGLHAGDLFVLTGWGVATAAVVTLALTRRQPTGASSARGAGPGV